MSETKRIESAPDLTKALADLLPLAGFQNMTDDELRHEAELGNEAAPIILAARAALASREATP